jgi:hypothetical protein
MNRSIYAYAFQCITYLSLPLFLGALSLSHGELLIAWHGFSVPFYAWVTDARRPH